MRHGSGNARSRAARRGPAVLLLAAVLALGAGGCLFVPRGAEPPVTGDEIKYIPRLSPGAVMENLDTALRARDAVGYMDQLGQTFRYVPDGQTTTDYPQLDWPNWDYTQEQTFATTLFNNTDAVTASMREVVIFNGEGATAVEWEFIYTLGVTSPGSTQPTPYRGRAFFKLDLEGSFWKLIEWRDVQGEADPVSGATLPTSGSLRGAIIAGGS
ncbi:MAG: hypothetical protein ACYDIE_12920 [Candidatus Krumholzibacteriia bacterium]